MRSRFSSSPAKISDVPAEGGGPFDFVPLTDLGMTEQKLVDLSLLPFFRDAMTHDVHAYLKDTSTTRTGNNSGVVSAFEEVLNQKLMGYAMCNFGKQGDVFCGAKGDKQDWHTDDIARRYNPEQINRFVVAVSGVLLPSGETRLQGGLGTWFSQSSMPGGGVIGSSKYLLRPELPIISPLPGYMARFNSSHTTHRAPTESEFRFAIEGATPHLDLDPDSVFFRLFVTLACSK